MSLFIWTDKNNLGIKEIDNHHKILASLINDLGESIGKEGENEAIERTLYTMLSYTGFHFKAEEDLMEKFKYPLLSDHKKQHDKFVSDVTSLKRRFTQKSRNQDLEVFQLLKNWFFKHTQGDDRKYASFFEDKGFLKEIDSSDGAADGGKQLKGGIVPLIVWNEKYDLGIKEIDEQHKKWAECINALHSSIGHKASCAEVQNAISGLKDYTRKHFTYEESILSKINYDKLDEQKEEHVKFRAEIDNLSLKFARYDTVVDFELILYMKGWFMEHIRGADKEYADLIIKKQT